MKKMNIPFNFNLEASVRTQMSNRITSFSSPQGLKNNEV